MHTSPPPRAPRPRAPLAAYRAERLAQPIALRLGLGFRAALYGLAPALLAASAAATVLGDRLGPPGFARGLGLFGLVFVGAAFALLLAARARAPGGVGMRLSEEGLYLAHLGVTAPWSAIGPAWVAETAQKNGMVATQAMLLVGDLAAAETPPDGFGRAYLALATRGAGGRTAVGWGGATLAGLMSDAPEGRTATALAALELRLGALRMAREAEGRLALGLPPALHGGLSAADLVAILNAETLRRA